jgi:DNA-binding CsgD family transcriptional regulator/GAF domain-containing protein
MLPSAESVSRLLGVLYESAASPERWPDFLTELRRTTSADTAYFILMDPQNRCSVFLNQGFDPALEHEYTRYFYKHDIIYERFIAAKESNGEWIGTRQSVLTDQDFHDSLIYNEFCIPQEIEHICAAALNGLDGKLEGGIGIQRTSRRQAFQKETVELLSILGPHLRIALNTHRTLNQLRAENAELRDTTQALDLMLISLDAEGRVLRSTRAVESILASRDGLQIDHGFLRASVNAEHSRLQEIITGAVATGQGRGTKIAMRRNTVASPEVGSTQIWTPPCGGAMLISRRPPKRALQVTITPFNSSEVFIGERPAALVFVTDPHAKPAPRASALRALYGLTPTECRLADLLAEGREITAAAEILRMTASTARFHLKSIFRKVGVKRQSDLIRLILSLPGETEVS